MKSEDPGSFRCGFIAVAGRPNVGKSTLVNRILGEELCIVTPKAQTTRNRITAIHSMADCQMIVVDTPGIHESDALFNQTMVSVARQTVEDADVGLMITEARKRVPDEDMNIIRIIAASEKPSVLVINKIDTVSPETLPSIRDTYSKLHDFNDIFLVSALKGVGVDTLITSLCSLLPISTPLYPEDDISDLPTRFFVAEMIREQVMLNTGEEIPYQTAVSVEEFKDRGSLTVIKADIHVERGSQKKIVIGKHGSMIKRIGTEARMKIQDFLGVKVHLELFVKISEKWTRDERKLKEFGYYIK